MEKDFNISYNKDKNIIYISTKLDITVKIIIYYIKDNKKNILYNTISNFNNNRFWYKTNKLLYELDNFIIDIISDGEIIKTKKIDFNNLIKRNDVLYPNSWNNNDQKIIYDDIILNNLYNNFFIINDNDIIVDLGTNIGTYILSILSLNKNIKKIYAIEPVKQNYEYAIKNIIHNFPDLLYKIIFLNIGVDVDGYSRIETSVSPILNNDEEGGDLVKTFSFMSFLKYYNISKIDILKFDIEGSEYNMFNEETFQYIFNNINRLCGEFHPEKKNGKQTVEIINKFIENGYNIRIQSIDYVDITDSYLNNKLNKNKILAWDFYKEIIFFAKKD